MKITSILIVSFTLFLTNALSQTVVNMKMPEQSPEALEVVTLFDEPLPVDIPVVLGIIGFNIKGGTNPYQFVWLRNDSIIGTGSTIVITPKSGNTYGLRVTDSNHCIINNTLNLSAVKKAPASNRMSNIKIYPTVVSDRINVEVSEFLPENTTVKILDIKGILLFEENIKESTVLYPKLPQGEYFVVIVSGEKYHVEKIIVTKN